jgi:hypothetical protein
MQKKPYPFATLSDDTTKTAEAVWAHLLPVLAHIKAVHPSVIHVTFVTDSPSSQYRNRYTLALLREFTVATGRWETANWIFHESGHGKGAPDGVGAAIKRAGDDAVRLGKANVVSVDALVSCVSPNILVFKVITTGCQ